MTTKALDFEIPPHIGAVIGGTTPSPGSIALGAVAYSTSLGRLVRWDGDSWEELVALANGTTAGLISATDFTKLGTLGVGIASSAGAADSGKVPKLDANGKLDPSFIPATLTLTGLTVNGHLILTGVVDGVDVSDMAAMSFVTMGSTGAVPNERVLSTAFGHAPVDGGPGGPVYFAHIYQTATQSGDYTFIASDRGGVIQFNNSTTAATFTMPLNLWPAGSEVFVQQVSSAKVSIAGVSGVAILIPPGTAARTKGPNSLLRLTNSLGQNVWTVDGDLEITTPFLTLGNTSDLAGERALSPAGGLKLVDGGAGGLAILSREPGLLGLGSAGTTVLTPANVQPEYAVRAASASGTPVIELPSDAAGNWAAGTRFDIFASNANNATLRAGSGATAVFFDQLAGVTTGTAGPVTLYSGNFAYAIKVAANTWHVFGVWDRNYAAASNNAPFLTVGNDASLNGERAFGIGAGLKTTDGGAGGTYLLELFETINSIGGSFSFAAQHNRQRMIFNGAAGQSATVPANATTAISAGFSLEIFNRSVVDYSVVAEAGGVVTFVGSSSPLVLRPGQGCRVTKVATDLWTAQRIDVTFSSSVQTIGATSNEGNDYTVAHGNHIHNHGALGYFDVTGNGRMHTLAVANAADGFISAASQAKLDSLGVGISSTPGYGDNGKVPLLSNGGFLHSSFLNAVAVSGGASDAGKLPLLDGTGKISATMLPPVGAALTISQVTVDFGSTPANAKAFSVTVSGATVGQKVIAVPSLDMPAGVDDDELEMDMLMCAGRVTAADTVRLIVSSSWGPITGQRNINVVLGS